MPDHADSRSSTPRPLSASPRSPASASSGSRLTSKPPPPSCTYSSSIGVGEDGPTHQPIEAGPWLRASPNVHFWRPAEGNETSAAYASALKSSGTPSVLALSRQNVPSVRGTSLSGAAKGAYVVRDIPNAAVTLVATGSEVTVALDAAVNNLAAQGVPARVVSMPCWEVFAEQSAEYKRATIGALPVVSVEAYSSFGWERWSHAHVGIDTFGDSAAPAVLFKHFGITPEVSTLAVAYLNYSLWHVLTLERRRQGRRPRQQVQGLGRPCPPRPRLIAQYLLFLSGPYRVYMPSDNATAFRLALALVLLLLLVHRLVEADAHGSHERDVDARRDGDVVLGSAPHERSEWGVEGLAGEQGCNGVLGKERGCITFDAARTNTRPYATPATIFHSPSPVSLPSHMATVLLSASFRALAS